MKPTNLKVVLTALSFFAFTTIFAQVDSAKSSMSTDPAMSSDSSKVMDVQGAPTGTDVNTTTTTTTDSTSTMDHSSMSNGSTDAMSDSKMDKKMKKASKKEAKAGKKMSDADMKMENK